MSSSSYEELIRIKAKLMPRNPVWNLLSLMVLRYYRWPHIFSRFLFSPDAFRILDFARQSEHTAIDRPVTTWQRRILRERVSLAKIAVDAHWSFPPSDSLKKTHFRTLSWFGYAIFIDDMVIIKFCCAQKCTETKLVR